MTDGAVVFVLVLEAIVSEKDMDANAHAAFRTVAEIFCATDAAKPTLVAMKGLFRVFHPQVTHGAVILGKHCVTVGPQVPSQRKSSKGVSFGGRQRKKKFLHQSPN
jgi:hypothetical protein